MIGFPNITTQLILTYDEQNKEIINYKSYVCVLHGCEFIAGKLKSIGNAGFR